MGEAPKAPGEGMGKAVASASACRLNVDQVAAPRVRGRDHSSIDSLRVLVVDDSHDAAESLAMLLRTAGEAGLRARRDHRECELHPTSLRHLAR